MKEPYKKFEQLTLGELIQLLETEVKKNPQILRVGIGEPHSYRGFYDQLAFEFKTDVTVAKMLQEARGALGNTYHGYKGGEYVMNEHTLVWLSKWGQSSEAPLTLFVLEAMFDQTLVGTMVPPDHGTADEKSLEERIARLEELVYNLDSRFNDAWQAVMKIEVKLGIREAGTLNIIDRQSYESL
jgi:hypothetical protein